MQVRGGFSPTGQGELGNVCSHMQSLDGGGLEALLGCPVTERLGGISIDDQRPLRDLTRYSLVLEVLIQLHERVSYEGCLATDIGLSFVIHSLFELCQHWYKQAFQASSHFKTKHWFVSD